MSAATLGVFAGGAFAVEPASETCHVTSHAIVGTWILVRYEDHPVDGDKPLYPFGEHPVGQLIYDASCHMSIQVMKVPHPKIASGDDEKVTPAEKQALYDSYVAYFGRYRVDETKHVVTHEVEGDLYDAFVGTSQERPYVLEGDTLKLVPVWESGGKKWRGVREFRRAR